MAKKNSYMAKKKTGKLLIWEQKFHANKFSAVVIMFYILIGV